MELDLIAIIAAVGAALLGLWALLRGGLPVTAEALGERISDIQVAVGAARELVLAAEQLWETGKIPAGERFTWVYERLQEIYPDLSEDTLRASIESAVQWMKLIGGKKGA